LAALEVKAGHKEIRKKSKSKSKEQHNHDERKLVIQIYLSLFSWDKKLTHKNN
jgi:hypothetical protein